MAFFSFSFSATGDADRSRALKVEFQKLVLSFWGGIEEHLHLNVLRFQFRIQNDKPLDYGEVFMITQINLKAKWDPNVSVLVNG